MPALTTPLNGAETLADLVHQLGGIPLHRIRMQPPPGTATEDDLLSAGDALDKRLCELVDGVLVEKDMGILESVLAGIILQHINNFLFEKELGISSGADGGFRTVKGKVRMPDVSVFTWKRLGKRTIPSDKIFSIAPNIAVEVVSEGNTVKEIGQKLREYFKVGVNQTWVIYPKTQTARVYTAPDKFKKVTKTQALTGGRVLPGFRLPMSELFELVEKPHERKRSRRRSRK